jgi:HSP20 family protein
MTVAAKEIQKKEANLNGGVERTHARKVYTPAVDIIEKEEEIYLLADMPGVDNESVEVTLEKDILTINGRVEPEIPEGMRLAGSEYGVGDYQRTFSLSDEIDRERIQASVKNGVLRLTLPKVAAVKTRKIPVRAEA